MVIDTVLECIGLSAYASPFSLLVTLGLQCKGFLIR